MWADGFNPSLTYLQTLFSTLGSTVGAVEREKMMEIIMQGAGLLDCRRYGPRVEERDTGGERRGQVLGFQVDVSFVGSRCQTVAIPVPTPVSGWVDGLEDSSISTFSQGRRPQHGLAFRMALARSFKALAESAMSVSTHSMGVSGWFYLSFLEWMSGAWVDMDGRELPLPYWIWVQWSGRSQGSGWREVERPLCFYLFYGGDDYSKFSIVREGIGYIARGFNGWTFPLRDRQTKCISELEHQRRGNRRTGVRFDHALSVLCFIQTTIFTHRPRSSERLKLYRPALKTGGLRWAFILGASLKTSNSGWASLSFMKYSSSSTPGKITRETFISPDHVRIAATQGAMQLPAEAIEKIRETINAPGNLIIIPKKIHEEKLAVWEKVLGE
ncbi:hypothetical protein M413DRAFT_12537 [Hebeloma cylindrosporum]|uniref:Uncharacterized protein n=1 Tax=Hebeloma cylindrosporum TaxID=76867 RepID=A0A0C3C3T1_HEBCY|nr:hypothetical protein M413DRAFT_12537 [Hebeloma cylindrosporum h7]